MARVVPEARVSFSGPLSPAYRCGGEGGGGLGECARRAMRDPAPALGHYRSRAPVDACARSRDSGVACELSERRHVASRLNIHP